MGSFQATPYTVTTALMVGFAVFVLYVRSKNWLESNVPIIFYILMIIYMRAVDGLVPMWLMLAGLGFGAMLRFEFMNPFLTKSVRFLEFCAITGMIYLSMRMVLQL
jgi:hypothetical protein